jgi:hypothetical protein
VPISQLLPQILAAGGALFGVALTLVTQAIAARVQRKHDRMVKAFDTRLDVYAEFLHELDKWTQLTQQVREFAKDPDILYLNQPTPEIDAAIGRFEKFVKSIPNREKSPEELKAIEAEGDRLRGEVEKLRSEDNARFEKGSAKAAKMSALQPVLEQHMDRLQDLGIRMNMLAGQPVIDATGVIIAKAAQGELPDSQDKRAFNMAARKELGAKLRD